SEVRAPSQESAHGVGHEVVFASYCPSGNSGSAELCFFASSQCAVLGKFMGRAPAATAAVIQSLYAAAVQSLCAAAVQSLWGPMGLRGLSSARKGLLSTPAGTSQRSPKGTAQRSREGAASGLLPGAAGRDAQGCHD